MPTYKDNIIVDFGFSSPALGKGEPPKSKSSKPTAHKNNLNNIIKIIDNNPVIRYHSERVIPEHWCLLDSIDTYYYMATITINPNMIKHQYVLLNESLQIKLFDNVFNIIKKWTTGFIGCLEKHKYRNVYHAHVMYKVLNKNRQSKCLKEVREYVSHKHSKVAVRNSGKTENIPAQKEYIQKVDENNKNSNKDSNNKYYYYYLKM